MGLRWFQFKVLQRILYTNDLLFKMNLVTRKECTFSNKHSEQLSIAYVNVLVLKIFGIGWNTGFTLELELESYSHYKINYLV